MIDLATYQGDAVGALADAIANLAGRPDRDRLVVLGSPTGSGKTVMLAAALDQVAQSFATLWLTPGKGGLADQSTRALRSHLDDSTLVVERLTPEWLSSHSLIEPGTLVVANWESLTQTSQTDGSRTNALTREGERRNLFRALQGTADDGTGLIVVIDESHWGDAAPGTSSLLDEIDAIQPALRIEASATPTRSTTPSGRASGRHVDVWVDLNDVIAAGMLVTEIRVNTGLAIHLDALSEEDRVGTTGEALVLDAAWARLSTLTERYVSIDSPVRPLLLIQIPNTTAGAAKLDAIEDHFRLLGVTRDNGQLAVWLAEDKTPDLDAIADFMSPTKVLVFKQAIATGWDCPRAQVLAAFREMQSEIFEIQTVGRIMRTPERRHYDDDELDVAYIYANIDAPRGPSSVNPDAPPTADVTMTRRVSDLVLPASYASRAGTFDDVKSSLFRACFAEAATTKGLAQRLPEQVVVNDTIATDRIVTVGDIYDGDDVISDIGDETVAVAMAEHDLQAAFDAFCAEHLGSYRGKARSLPILRQTIYDWVVSQKAEWWTGDAGDLVLVVQRLIHTPARVALAETLDLAIATHRERDEAPATRSRTSFIWHLPETLQISSGTHGSPLDATGYAYSDDNDAVWRPNASNPETDIESALAAGVADGTVRWWWKNGESDRRHFSVAYTKPDGTVSTTYPDYVAELVPTRQGNRRIAILEGKGPTDSDDCTPAKAEAIAAWARQTGEDHPDLEILAGIVVPLAGGLGINNGENYTHPCPTSLSDKNSGWKPLSFKD